MTDSKSDFQKVKKLFDQMVELDDEVRSKIWIEIHNEGSLSDGDLELLKQMLSADSETSLATQSDPLSQRVISQAVLETELIEEKQFGAYKLIKIIGSGGMGQVYLAERSDGQFEQKVALKISHANISDDLKRRFENERQILSDLSHANIARLLDGGTSESGKPFIVMEYIEGQNIAEYCVNKQPRLEQRIKLVLQICSAITLAHQKLVLHRDLKPENILVTEQGEVKLLDFGIAKLMSEDSKGVNKTATQIMTRYYASPEQIKGQAVSTQSDLFSLAIIAFELITGCHPFYKNSDTENNHLREQNVLSGQVMRIQQRHDIEKPLFPELSNIPSSKIKGDLEHILLKALVAEPEDRYSSVSAFSDDLNLYLDNKPISAQKPSKFYTLKKLIQRQKVASAAVIFTIFTLLFATGFSIWKAEQAQQQKLLADAQKQVAEVEAEKSQQLADFLKTLFQNAQPMSSEKQLTAQDLLTQGFDEAKSANFIHQETKFELLELIHESLMSLGKYTESEEVSEQHYKDCVSELGEIHYNCQGILQVRTKIMTTNSQDEEALVLLNLAERISMQREPMDREELFDIRAQKVTAFLHLDRFEEAFDINKKTLAFEKNLAEPNPQRIVQVLHNLAILNTLHKRFDESRRYIDQIPAYLENFSDEDKPIWYGAHYGLEAHFYSTSKQALKAYEFRKKRVGLMRESYEVLPENYGRYLSNAGDMAFRSNLIQESIDYHAESFQFYKERVTGSERKQFQELIEGAFLNALLGNWQQAKKLNLQANQLPSEIINKLKTSQRKNKATQLMLWISETTQQKLAANFNQQYAPLCVDRVVKNRDLKFTCEILKIEYFSKTENLIAAAEAVNTMKMLADTYPMDNLFYHHQVEQYQKVLVMP